MLEKNQAANLYLMNILMKLKQFKDDDKLCDITINVHGKQFKAHKAILAAWSPKLASTILSLNGSRIFLTVTYANEDAFSEVLEYLYSGYIVPEESNVKSLIDIAKNLMIDPLVNICEDYLKTSTSLGNFVLRYFTSLKYGLTSLEQYVVTFIETNILFVIEQECLLGLSPQDLKCFLTMGKMSQAKQEIRFTIIINWIGFDIGHRDKYLLSLVKNLSWNSSVNDLLNQLSSMENIFTSNEFCLFQLLHSIVTATGHQLGPFTSTYPRLLSVYSDVVEELIQQDQLLISSLEVNMIDPIPISAETVKPEKVDYSHSPEKKDAEMNTDVDSSYFIEETDVSFKESVKHIPVDIVSLDEDTQSTLASQDKDLEEVDVLVSDDVMVLPLDDANKPSEKHRRKNKPRKISKDGEIVQKEKKKRGRPKKVMKKEVERIVIPEMKELPVNTDDDDGETDHDEYLASEQTINEHVEQDDQPMDTGENVKIENIDSDFESIRKKESKADIKLKYKSIKSKRDTQRLRKRKLGTLSRKTSASVPTRRRHFECSSEDCDFTSRSESGLTKHIESAHSINVKLVCRNCDYTTSQMRLLCIHLKQHYKKPPYICEETGCSQRFLRMGLFVRHQMSHMNEKPYKCDLCAKSFGTFNQLSCHKKLHEGRQYECDVCYKRFTTKGAMQQHRAIHFDNKPYLCDTCGFSTKHLSHLISHRKIHSGDVLRCTFPNCTYSTPKQGHMTQHVNTHLNIRNHICQVCGKSFVVRGKLLRHERIHLKDKLYKCKQCDYQTSRTDRMKLHIESHGIKFKKRKYNLPNVEEEEEKQQQLDYHQLYERVHPSELGDGGVDSSLNTFNMHTMGDIKMDALTLAASASMIVDNFTTVRLDPLGTASVTSLEEMQAAAFQSYDVDVVL